jgi:sugar phosphate isomerase/epimerase
MFRYFTSSVMFAEQSFDTACAAIASAGIRDVDIWSIKGWCEHIPPNENEPDWDALRETLAKHGLRCAGFSLYGSPDEMIRVRLPQMATLGGKTLVIGSASPDVSVEAFAERMRPLADRARDLGVTLAVENHGNATIDSIASMVEVCERIPHEGFGIALAPIHLHRRNEETADAIRALGQRIALFYAWDWGPTADKHWKNPQEQIPGWGVISFKPIFAALREIAYARPLCLFAHGVEHRSVAFGVAAIHEALGYLRAVERELDGRTI